MRVEAGVALPADAASLYDPTEFQLGAAWFGAVAAAALPAQARPAWLTARAAGRPRVVLPLVRTGDGRLAGLASPYTSLFRPLVAADAASAEIEVAGRAFARVCRGSGTLLLEALDPDWPGLAPLLGGFRRGGMVALRFAQFGNWHTEVAGQTWEAYLAARPAALRNTIRRRLARAAAIGFEIVTGGAGLESGIAAYEAVYARSWKPAEPFPHFPAALMRAAASAGALRLGLLRAGGAPVAAQLWVVAGGIATVHKLAHAEAARALSPGTVLTALMIRHLLAEGVAGLDFGRGDDAYKAGWTGRRRQRVGVLLCAPWHPVGAAAIARHVAGRLARRFATARPMR